MTDIQCFEKWYGGKFVNCKNSNILKEVAVSLEGICISSNPKSSKVDFFRFFTRSLGPYIDTIDGHLGYNETTLFYQRDFIMRRRGLTDSQRREQLWLLVRFYSDLCTRYPDVGYFNDGVCMSYKLLQNVKLPTLFLEGWTFVNYSPLMEYGGESKIVFTLHGFDRHSTRIAAKDYYPLHLYKIHSPFFRKLFFDYMKSSYIRFGECTAINVGCIGEIMNTMCSIKASSISTVPDESHWTIQEARLMKKIIDESRNTWDNSRKGESISLGSKNNRIGFMRRWFQWAANNGRMTFEKMFFDELSQFEEPTKHDAKPIPPEHLQLVFEKARELSGKTIRNRLCYLAMKLIHQTNFRPSDILSMTVSGLQKSVSQGVHVIKHKTKTSGPRRQVDPLTKYDYDILKEAISITEDLRNNAPDASMKDRIFLYRKQTEQTDVMTAKVLRSFMRQVCDELGIKRYSPYNIRYTYMTKVFENAVINDLSESEVQVLTKHVKLGTTMGYVKKSRDDYFKALYQVMLEDVQVNPMGKVVEKMPEQAQELSEREGGCGRCRAANCLFKSILPCITCENFVTTVEYEPFFKRMIAHIDEQMKDATYPHDREDLVTMKEVYVSFLIEIDRLKSQKNHE